MSNDTQDAKPQGSASLEAGTKPPETPASPAAPATAAATNPAPASTAVAAGPAPQVTFTPDPAATGITAGQPQPAPVPEALIGSWLAEHVHHADRPYLALVVILAFLLGSFAATNTDIWLNLATGRMLSEGKYRLGTDPFATTLTPDGVPRSTTWVNHSWLYSWISYMLYSEGGTVLVVLKALCVAMLAVILLMARPRNRHGWAGTMCVLLGILAMSTAPGLMLNSMVISLLFLGATVLILVRAGVLAQSAEQPAQPKVLWALPPLFVLWINVDSWFIIGPMIVACCLAGLLLEAGLGKKPPFSIAQLSKVLGVSVLASLLNPHHIRAVVQLPLEISYLLVRAGSFWPESMVAGGKALTILQAFDRNSTQTISPVQGVFWENTAIGLNVAGISFYVLLLVVLFSFYLCKQANSGMLLVRAVPALLCITLALLMVRLIPLFAVVGAVIAALNVQEYLVWRETTQPAKMEEQNLWANMTRLIMGFGYFGLLFLAWPGWINHTMGGFTSPRRVAWTIPVEPSLEATAKFLNDKNDKGELKLKRALNINREIANFSAWHAPEMRFFLDHRLQLYDKDAQLYVEMQQSIFSELMGQSTNNRVGWREEFKRQGIDSIVTPVAPVPYHPGMALFMHGMLPGSDRVSVYVDGKTAVIAWKFAAKKMPSLDRQWRDLAFGKRQAPWPEEITVPEDAGLWGWGLYFQGHPQPLLAAKKAELLQFYFEQMGGFMAQKWFDRGFAAWQLASFGMPNNLSIGPMPLLLNAWGSPLRIEPEILDHQRFCQMYGIQMPAPPQGAQKGQAPEPFHVGLLAHEVTQDSGPPEAAILAVRSARKAVAENPEDPVSHYDYASAVRFIKVRQEDAWTRMSRTRLETFKFDAAGQGLRVSLRKFQYIAALQRVARLKPTDPNVHRDLFHFFKSENCIDMALEHLQYWGEYIDASKTDEKKYVENLIKAFKEEVAGRMSSLEVRTFPKDTAVKKAHTAFDEPYETPPGPDGKPGQYMPPLGLMKEAHKVLIEFVAAQPKDVTEKAQAAEMVRALELLFKIDLLMGNLWELKSIDLDQHPDFRLKFFYHGATGDYAKADKELADLDKALKPQEDLEKASNMIDLFRWTVSQTVPTVAAAPLTPYPTLHYRFPRYFRGAQVNAGVLEFHQFLLNTHDLERAERLTLRGILALEVGNTVAALAHFDAALNLAGPERFYPDRGIAERYKEQLDGAAR